MWDPAWRPAVWTQPERWRRGQRNTRIQTHVRHANPNTHARTHAHIVFSTYPLSLSRAASCGCCWSAEGGACGEASIWGNPSKRGVGPACVGALCWLFQQTCFPKARKEYTKRGALSHGSAHWAIWSHSLKDRGFPQLHCLKRSSCFRFQPSFSC